MDELIYIDSNVYLDYLENRVDRLRPLGEFALRLIQRALECEFKIIISSLVIEEVEKHVTRDRVDAITDDLKGVGKLIRIEITLEDEKKAKELIKTKDTHFKDALHAVLAYKTNAKVLVTRNIKDFADLQDLVDVKLPESI